MGNLLKTMIKKLVTATWCAPCKMLKSKLADAGITVETIDANDNPEYIAKHSIRSVPTLVIEGSDGVEIVAKYEEILDILLDDIVNN